MPSHFKPVGAGKSNMALEAVRTANAKIVEAERKAYVPPAVEWKDYCSYTVSRCVSGPQGWPGLFRIIEIDKEKKAKKVLISGVDIHTALGYLETAARRRVFK
jgi:hypothetical protein